MWRPLIESTIKLGRTVYVILKVQGQSLNLFSGRLPILRSHEGQTTGDIADGNQTHILRDQVQTSAMSESHT